MSTVVYLLDRIPFKNYNIYVSDSSNLFDKPSFKEGLRVDWKDEHGFDIDLSKRFNESKQITLDCFIPSNFFKDCIEKFNTFLNEIDKRRSIRLSVIAGELRLEFQLFRSDSAEIKLQYDDVTKVGLFKLKLVENMPVKRILKATNQSTTITINSPKILVINWGDGTERYTQPGNNTYTKGYLNFQADQYFPIIMGDIDSITSFTSNTTVLWNKF